MDLLSRALSKGLKADLAFGPALIKNRPIIYSQTRSKYYNNRHRVPEYRALRAKKVWSIDLPNFDQFREEKKLENYDEIRSKQKEKGIAPPSRWNEKSLFMGHTFTLMDPYDASKDESSSSITGKIKTLPSVAKDLFKLRKDIAKIRSYEGEDFSVEKFAEQSTGIYIKAHQLLIQGDNDEIFDYVTEFCLPQMRDGLKQNTIEWTYVGEIEPARVVQVRAFSAATDTDIFAQITVRMHSKQIVTIYDRHGRLIHGSPNDVREVLEYIVFEKYLTSEFSEWRIHSKIKSPKENESELALREPKTYVAQKV